MPVVRPRATAHARRPSGWVEDVDRLLTAGGLHVCRRPSRTPLLWRETGAIGSSCRFGDGEGRVARRHSDWRRYGGWAVQRGAATRLARPPRGTRAARGGAGEQQPFSHRLRLPAPLHHALSHATHHHAPSLGASGRHPAETLLACWLARPGLTSSGPLDLRLCTSSASRSIGGGEGNSTACDIFICYRLQTCLRFLSLFLHLPLSTSTSAVAHTSTVFRST